MANFCEPEVCGQTVLPDKPLLIGQKLMKNAKVEKFKCGIFSNFQTMYIFILDSKIHISFPFQ